MTPDEAAAIHARPEYEGRVAVYVRQVGDEFVATWRGRDFRAGTIFGLDSKLTDGGAPSPRNIYLIEEGK